MGRYLILWEADESKIPLDAKERQAGWLMALEMTREDMKAGLVKDYGVFLGQANGFDIAEGTEEEITNMAIKYMPFFRFKMIPIASIDQVEAAIKAMA
jgi:hypothetical protein